MKRLDRQKLMESKTHRQFLEGLSKEHLQKLRAAVAKERLTGHALVAEALQLCGISHLAGITGTPVNEIFQEAAKRRIRLLGTRHQFTATIMAATENYLADRLKHAVCVSAGPAVTNTVTGILHAFQNNWPLLVIGGCRSIEDNGSGQFQEFDAVPLMKPITKWAATVTSTDQIMPMIHKACALAVSGQPGPVYLDFPEDVLYSSAVPIPLGPIEQEIPTSPDLAEIESALRHLRGSKRPLLCLGEGLRHGFDQEPIRDLVEREQIPFITTPMGRGLLPDDHSSCVNRVRHKAMQSADVFILAGAWFDWRFRMGTTIGPTTQVIHVHPNKEKLGKNIQPLMTFNDEPMTFMRALSQSNIPDVIPTRISWHDELKSMMERDAPQLTGMESVSEGYANPGKAMALLQKALPEDAIIVLEGSIHLSISQHLLSTKTPFSWLDPGQTGLIGGGIPMAMGAQCAFPDQQVIAIIGDTGFGMSGLDLEATVRHNIPIKVMVMNNSGISGEHRQNILPPISTELFSKFQDALPYDAVAQAMGLESGNVSCDADLHGAIDRMLGSPSPYCLNVHVDPSISFPPIW